MSEKAVTLRQWLEWAGLSSLVWLIGRLPYPAVRPVANFIGEVVYVFDRRGRRVARANLDAAFGDKWTPACKRRIARESYHTFARTMLELFWSPNLNEKTCRELVRFEGLELYPCHQDKTQPVIYVTMHYSHFEWLALAGVYPIGTGIVVAQRFRNPLLGPIFDRLRGSTGNEVIPQERAMIRTLKYLRSGGKFGLLVDLNLDPTEAGVIIESFGGLKTCVTQMHAALAQRTGAKIVPVVCRPMAGAGYRFVYHPPLEYPPEATAAEIVQQCWNVLESSIREQPECWLWAYKHWRFKPSGDATGRYPFYANTAKRFDKLLKKGTL